MIGGNTFPPHVQIVQVQQYAYTYFVHFARLTYAYTYGIIYSESKRAEANAAQQGSRTGSAEDQESILQDTPKLKNLQIGDAQNDSLQSLALQ